MYIREVRINKQLVLAGRTSSPSRTYKVSVLKPFLFTPSHFHGGARVCLLAPCNTPLIFRGMLASVFPTLILCFIVNRDILSSTEKVSDHLHFHSSDLIHLDNTWVCLGFHFSLTRQFVLYVWWRAQLLLWCWLQRNYSHFAQLESPPVSLGDIFIWFPCFSFTGSKTTGLNHPVPWEEAEGKEGCTQWEKEGEGRGGLVRSPLTATRHLVTWVTEWPREAAAGLALDSWLQGTENELAKIRRTRKHVTHHPGLG